MQQDLTVHLLVSSMCAKQGETLGICKPQVPFGAVKGYVESAEWKQHSGANLSFLTPEEGPEKGHKYCWGLDDKLRELVLFSLHEKRVRETLQQPFST